MRFTATWRVVEYHERHFDEDSHLNDPRWMQNWCDNLEMEPIDNCPIPETELYRVTDENGVIWYDIESEEHGSSYENPPCANCGASLRDASPDTWECDECGRIVSTSLWVIEQGEEQE